MDGCRAGGRIYVIYPADILMTELIKSSDYISWGRVERPCHRIFKPTGRDSAVTAFHIAEAEGLPLLGHGLGRSYGDSNLNPDGMLFAGRALDQFISFDSRSGLLCAEAGVSLADILEVVVPRGFFLPTTPGSKFVTLAGAVANDVHGKNHHSAGSIGNHVTRFGLVRSDLGELEVSEHSHPEIFAATIGGLGLTGLITWVEIQLTHIPSSYIAEQTTVFSNIEEFFDIEESNRDRFEHTVAWIDCTTRGSKLGRGIYSGGNWSDKNAHEYKDPSGPTLPFDLPTFALNPFTLKAFNMAYFMRQKMKPRQRDSHYSSFFYPLDAIQGWNRLYGRNGFYQYQSVIPLDNARAATREMLETISSSGQGSMLAVLKTFGNRTSPGWMSFPQEGATLALDFKNSGARTLHLLSRLDEIVLAAGGRLYPAKDGRISADVFQESYPRWNDLERLRDPLISSAFWRRVTRSE